MEYRGSSVTLSKKLSNGHSFSGKSVYDDVFASPSKFRVPSFSSRVEDYREIFGGSGGSRGGSSIPILEVPELNEGKIAVDVGSSKLDYSKIFGGFGDSDFAVPFEELQTELPNTRQKFSPDESLNPAESSPQPSKVADACSEENHDLSQEAYCQSFDGVKKFSMSYQKSNKRIENGLNGTTHIAQLHAVPGFTCLIDEVTQSRMTKDDNLLPSVANGTSPKDNMIAGKMESNNLRKSMTDLPVGDMAGTKTCKGGVEFENKSNQSRSYTVDELFDAHKLGNGTPQPNLQPSSSFPSDYGINYDTSRTSMASKFQRFSTCASEGCANGYSFPPFDEEVDTNSVAAISMAALKKAIEEAQARMKIAKESMERKKSGIQNQVKVGFDDRLKVEERKKVKIAELTNGSKIKTTRDTCEERDVSPYSAGTVRINAIGSSQVITDIEAREKVSSAKEADSETVKEFRSVQPDHWQEDAEIFEESEQFYEVAKEADNETLGKEFSSSHENYKQEDAETYEEEDEFYEVTNTGNHWDALSEFEADKDAKNVMQSMDRDEWKEEKIAKEVFEQLEEGGERLKPTEGEGEPEEMEKCFKGLDTVKMKSESEKHDGKFLSGADAFYHEESEGRQKVSLMQGETEKKVQAFFEKDESQKEQNELQEALENEKILGNMEAEDFELSERQPLVRESVENKNNKEVNKNNKEEIFKLEEIEMELKDAHERTSNKASKQDAFMEGLNDPHQREEIEERPINESHLEKEEFQQVVEDEKMVEVDVYKEEEDEEMIKVDAYQVEENEKIFEVDVYLEEEIEEIIEVDAAYQEEEYEKIQVEIVESMEAGGVEETRIQPGAEDGLVKMTNEDLRSQENSIEEDDNLCKHESDSLNKIQRHALNIDSKQATEVSMEVPASEESGSIREANEVLLDLEENRKELELIEEINYTVEREILETDSSFQSFKLTKLMPTEYMIDTSFLNRNGINLDITGTGFMSRQHDQQTRDFEIVCNLGKHAESLVPELEKMNKDVKETEGAVKHADEGNGYKYFEVDGLVDNEIDIRATMLNEISDSEAENVALGQGIKTSLHTEKDHENHQNTLTGERAETYVESYQETIKSLNSEKEEKHYETLPNEGMQHQDENHRENQTSHSTETNVENQQETLTAEEGETNESFLKELEQEKEHLKRIDEAKGREKEKERIAVERAIREARERAFAEAKERAAAEKAAAEARRRPMAAEARERIGRDSAEANDKSLAEKAYKEAKLKAERAAVERATAEARVRALEKAMSGKAVSETRKQTERFASEKVSGVSCSSSTSSFSNSSNHGAPNATERSDEFNGESAQRCKARLERHQRTAERAAKALAEKNMRDLFAQKEQAERNRLAEVLDAEVKRWSSGKEGNLRALLSTLQYILGPDSGWQPVHLTDIIATTAVKKAYRKATLFVHPDKLQQRGASIQQKYTCEKVFDLLKEAWNRFNVEER